MSDFLVLFDQAKDNQFYFEKIFDLILSLHSKRIKVLKICFVQLICKAATDAGITC